MSRSTSHPLFITALFALMVTACASAPTPTERGAVEVEREPGETLEAAQARKTRKTQYEKAKAVFDERCKTAGVKIYRTVEDVEGVFLVDLKPQDPNIRYNDLKDPNWAYAGLPDESTGQGYIAMFLYSEHPREKAGSPPLPLDAKNRGALTLNSQLTELPGYRYVDVKNDTGGIDRYRLYKPSKSKPAKNWTTDEHLSIARESLQTSPTRYAISRTNHIVPTDRALWVAGTTITITDTQTNEMLATSTWYSFDPGQGSTVGFRSPWLQTLTCPESSGWTRQHPTRFFADQVLKPKAH